MIDPLLFTEAISGGVVGVAVLSLSIGAAACGLLFRGAAAAWREERDAAIDRANRLENKVADQDVKISDLTDQVETLKLTNVKHLSDTMSREHRHIVDELRELAKATNTNTIAIEFLIKQAFPTATFPVARESAA